MASIKKMSAFFFPSSQAFIMVMIYITSPWHVSFFFNMYLTVKEFLTHLIYASHLKSLRMNFGYMPHTALYDKKCQFWGQFGPKTIYLIDHNYILSYFKYYYNNCTYTFAILISPCSYLLDIVKMSLLYSVFFFSP